MFKLQFQNDETHVTFNVLTSTDGEEWKLHSNVALDASAIPPELADGDGYKSVLTYGLLKLVQDRNSDLTKKKLDDMGIDPDSLEAVEVRIKAYQETYDLLLGGQWKVQRESAGKKAVVDAIFVEAVQLMFEEKTGNKPPLAAVQGKLQSMANEERKALRELVAPMIAKLKLEAKEETSDNELDFGELL